MDGAQTSFEARLFAVLDQHEARAKAMETQMVVMTVGIMAGMMLVALGIYTIGKQLDK